MSAPPRMAKALTKCRMYAVSAPPRMGKALTKRERIDAARRARVRRGSGHRLGGGTDDGSPTGTGRRRAMTTGRPPAQRRPLHDLRDWGEYRLLLVRHWWAGWRSQEVTREVLPDGRVKKKIITKPPGGVSPWAPARWSLPLGWRTGLALLALLLLVAIFGEGLCNRGELTRMMTGVEVEKMNRLEGTR